MPLTVSMVAVVEFQHTFSDSELEHYGLTDVEPSDEALQALVIRLENTLRPEFQPKRVELEMDAELEEEEPDLNWKPLEA